MYNIFVYNKYNDPVYAVLDNNLFGEYELISSIKTNYSVKVHPRMAAYGFVLKKEDWENISKKYMISAKKFVETIILRHKKHNEWIIRSLNISINKNNIKDNKIFEKEKSDEIIDKNKDSLLIMNDNSENIGAINDSISLRYDDIKNKNANINVNKKNLITLAKSKSIDYDINNQEICLKVDDVIKELQNFENDLFIFKNELLRNMKQKNF